MQVKIDRVISSSKRGVLQVTIVTGKGAGRRSITKFAHPRGGDGYFGLNPDERAIPLNAKYEAKLRTAKADLASAEAALKNMRKRLEEAEEAEPGTLIDGVYVAVAKELLQTGIVIAEDAVIVAEDAVDDAEAAVDDAETKLTIVRRELPLEVEFVGVA